MNNRCYIVASAFEFEQLLLCLRSLPKSVRRRVKALKRLQFDMVKLESKFFEEVHQLECKYAEMYAPILEEVGHSCP